ncbi:MAG: DUF4198 domain-containing protein [Chloroflexi bacterium]|nr:DUF4198 domain-containing protein [Chloroflexota bacterium]
MRPRWIAAAGLILALLVASTLVAHDLFLVPARFFVAPNSVVRVRVLNGTFTKSDAAVAWDRVAAASLVGPAGVTELGADAWQERGDTSVLTLRAGDSGTYVVGLSVQPRMIRLEAAEFNEYLRIDGVPDVLEARRESGELDEPARERYSKHVKALLQVGDARTETYATVLGYPAELVPLSNPYALHSGDTLPVRALVDDAPVADQFIVAGWSTQARTRIAQDTTRTDAQGIARIPLRSEGRWYIKFIHMAAIPADTTLDYESKWTTLTFEIR